MQIQSILEVSRRNRDALINFLMKYDLGRLNAIPAGFNNNIFWNIGHVLSIQQILVYKLSNSRWRVSNDVVKEFNKGTKPERNYTKQDVDEMIITLKNSIDQYEIDYSDGYFGEVTPYKTGLGFEISSVEDAMIFNVYHEALHMGQIIKLIQITKDYS